jgi:phosphotransferase system HPr (HPr) family protein
VAGEFSGTVTLRNGDKVADAKTILELVSLVASQGTVLEVEASGEGCDAVVAALRDLFAAGFPTGEAAGSDA